jgi:hypothetical protein
VASSCISRASLRNNVGSLVTDDVALSAEAVEPIHLRCRPTDREREALNGPVVVLLAGGTKARPGQRNGRGLKRRVIRNIEFSRRRARPPSPWQGHARRSRAAPRFPRSWSCARRATYFFASRPSSRSSPIKKIFSPFSTVRRKWCFAAKLGPKVGQGIDGRIDLATNRLLRPTERIGTRASARIKVRRCRSS